MITLVEKSYFCLDTKVTKDQGLNFFPCFSHPRNCPETQALKHAINLKTFLQEQSGFVIGFFSGSRVSYKRPTQNCYGGKTT